MVETRDVHHTLPTLRHVMIDIKGRDKMSALVDIARQHLTCVHSNGDVGGCERGGLVVVVVMACRGGSEWWCGGVVVVLVVLVWWLWWWWR